MIDWKRFEDEVPTEPRSVVTYGPTSGGGFLLYDGVSKRQDETAEGWVSDLESVWHIPAIEGDCEAWWRESAESRSWTHWAYIDPPSDLGATPALEGASE